MYGLWWWASPNKAPNSSKKVEEEEGISVVSHVHPKALAHHHLEVEQFYDLFWMMMKPAMRPSGHTFHPSWSWSSLHTEQPHKDSRVKLWVAKLQGNSSFLQHIMRWGERTIGYLIGWRKPSHDIYYDKKTIYPAGQTEGEENYFLFCTDRFVVWFLFHHTRTNLWKKTSYFQINWFSNWSKSSSL